MAELTVLGAVVPATLSVLAADLAFQADGVILFAVMGAGVAAWAQQARNFEPTIRWVAAALSAFFMAVVVGVVTPHLVFAYAPTFAILKPMAAVPPYIVALASAAASQIILTLARRRIKGSVPTIAASESPSDQ